MILETERLILREMDQNDFNSLYAVLADSDIMEHYPYTFDEVRVRNWISRNVERYSKDGFGLWAVVLKETGEMIGDCGITMQNIHDHLLPEIGYHIHKDQQRKGYASEAAAACIRFAFENYDFPAVYSYMKHTKGLYLAGIECPDDALPPEGWTRWTVPGFEYLRVLCDHDGIFPEMIAYLEEHNITLAGAVHDFTCPQTGTNYMYFPIRKL